MSLKKKHLLPLSYKTHNTVSQFQHLPRHFMLNIMVKAGLLSVLGDLRPAWLGEEQRKVVTMVLW